MFELVYLSGTSCLPGCFRLGGLLVLLWFLSLLLLSVYVIVALSLRDLGCVIDSSCELDCVVRVFNG